MLLMQIGCGSTTCNSSSGSSSGISSIFTVSIVCVSQQGSFFAVQLRCRRSSGGSIRKFTVFFIVRFGGILFSQRVYGHVFVLALAGIGRVTFALINKSKIREEFSNAIFVFFSAFIFSTMPY